MEKMNGKMHCSSETKAAEKSCQSELHSVEWVW